MSRDDDKVKPIRGVVNAQRSIPVSIQTEWSLQTAAAALKALSDLTSPVGPGSAAEDLGNVKRSDLESLLACINAPLEQALREMGIR